MICDVIWILFDLDLLNPTMVMQRHALCCVWFTDCYWFPVSLWGDEMYVYETLDLSLLSHQSVVLVLLSSGHDGTEVLFWSLMMSCCDMLTWPFWGSLFSIILGYFLVACWEPKCIVIYFEMHFGCSLRTNAYCDLFWDTLRLLVENRWILWLIKDAFSCQ